MESDGSVTGERDTDDDETFTDSEQYRSRGTSRSTPSASIASHDGFRIRLLVPTARVCFPTLVRSPPPLCVHLIRKAQLLLSIEAQV